MSSRPFSFVRKSIDSLCQSAIRHLRQWTKPDNQDLVLNVAIDLTRSKSELLLENMLLRQQVLVLQRQVKRPQLTWRDRTFFVLLSSRLRTWKHSLVIVQPEPVVLAEKCHPVREPLVTTNNPKGLFILNDEFSNG